MPSEHHFFGLTADYDQRVMDQIFDLTVNLNAGDYSLTSNFTFTELYEMPVNLRSYYYLKFANLKAELQKIASENAQKNKGKR